MCPKAMSTTCDSKGVEDMEGDVDGQNPENSVRVKEGVNHADNRHYVDDGDVESHIWAKIVFLLKLNH